jgi:hypothetical protein
MLDTNRWEKFVDGNFADSAIGGPTVEMFIESWNAKGYKTLYCNNMTEAGYYIGSSDSPTSAYINLPNLDANGAKDELYIPHDTLYEGVYGYYLSSPAVGIQNNQILQISNSHIFCNNLSFKSAIRPVVCLKTKVKGTLNVDEAGNNIWSIE